MRILVVMEFDGDVDNAKEMLELAETCLNESGEGCYCDTKVLSIKELKAGDPVSLDTRSASGNS